MHLKVLEISYFHANFPTNLQVSGSIFEEVVKSGQKLNVADIVKVRYTVDLPSHGQLHLIKMI